MSGSGIGGVTSGGSVATGGTPAGGTTSMPDFDFTTDPDQATAYMVDASHSGAALGTRIEPPLERIWWEPMDGAISYPVIADGRVFVSVNSPGTQGPVVYAFDVLGGILWYSSPIDGNFGASSVHLAYDRGLLVAANEFGHVVGFEAATGVVRWDVRIDSIYNFGSMPVAIGGAVYLTGPSSPSSITNSSLYVLDQRDGRVVFEKPSEVDGHPTFGDERIFSSAACHETVGLDARSGEELWHYQEDCFGGGSNKTLFHDGLVLVDDGSDPLVALHGASGELASSIDFDSANWPPNAVGGLVLLQTNVGDGWGLRAFELRTGAERWSVELEEPSMHALVTPGYVYVLSARELYGPAYLSAVDLETHELAWQATEPAFEEHQGYHDSGNEPFQAMAAGGGIIVVPWSRAIAAFRSAR